ncbi:MAG: GNAT family N-acetyltransferase [Thermomicrobiales bacterium]
MHRLDQPDSLIENYSSLRHGLRSLLPFSPARPRVFVARTDTDIVGFADFQPTLPDQRWILTGLGVVPERRQQLIRQTLLSRGIVEAGHAGVKRLFVRLAPDHDVYEAAASCGFSPYAEEVVLSTTAPTFRAPTRALRMQEPSDTWAIHQLYNAAVPKQVQSAEAFTSHRWELPAPRATVGCLIRGWVIDEDHQVVGYARTASSRGTHVIEVIGVPGRRDVAEALVDGVLASLASRSVRRVYCAVRGYQYELIDLFRGRGFAERWTQRLMVTYTTASVRSVATEVVPLAAEALERVPRRVPTFLRGNDESFPDLGGTYGEGHARAWRDAAAVGPG